MKTRTFAGLLVAVAIAFMAGCTSPLTLRDTYKAPGSIKHSNARKHPIAATTQCVVHLAVVTDHRTDPSLLGIVAGRSVSSPGQGPQWIAGLLSAGLAHHGVHVSEALPDATSKHVVVEEVRLLKAWVASVSTSMNSSIVVGVSQLDGAEERIYRGARTSLNWANGDGEIQALFDSAVEELVIKLSADLTSQCASM